ncbi:MAG: hypothetical protein LBQ15_12475 [Clostridium sp.]|jgi:hypothetical protein|nr:hypothetical protein [Clostridium sp.]
MERTALLDFYREFYKDDGNQENWKKFLLRPLRPNMPAKKDPDADQREIAEALYQALWEEPICDACRGDTLFSPKGGWADKINGEYIFGAGQIVLTEKCEELNKEYADFDNGTESEWYNEKFSSNQVKDSQLKAWKQYHCLANFMPMPIELNHWRGDKDYKRDGYVPVDWCDRIDKYLAWVKKGYQGENVRCLQDIFEKKHSSYFEKFEDKYKSYLEKNFLPDLTDINAYKEKTLLDTLNKFLRFRAEKMAEKLIVT